MFLNTEFYINYDDYTSMMVWNYFLLFGDAYLVAMFFKIDVSPTLLVAECPESECFSGRILVNDSLECDGFV